MGGNPERRNYYRFLYHLIREVKPRLALEIGVESGLGSGYMAIADICPVIGIDHQNKVHPYIADSFNFIEGDATDLNTWAIVREMVNDYGKIGIVYQDSSHHYEASRREFELYGQLLAPGAIWICDDITPAFHDPLIDPPGKGMVQYFEELPGDKRLYKDVLHYGNTQGIVLL